MVTRKKGDGSFKILPSGTIEFSVEIPFDMYGKRQRKRFYGKTEAECRKKYRQFLKEGEPKSSSKEHTLSSWLNEWLKIYKKGKVEDSTFKNYKADANRVSNHKIGSMKLSQVKAIHVTDFFNGLSNLSNSAQKHMRFLLRSAFEAAIDNDLCIKNPAKSIKVNANPQSEKEAFTEDEMRTIISFAKNDAAFGLPIYIMLHTGIRSQEMRALSPKQFDFEQSILIIDRAIKRSGNEGLTKNKKTRYIPLRPEISEYIKEKLDKNVNYVLGGNDYVTASSIRCSYESFFERLNKYLVDNGMKPIDRKSPHSTRHTFSTVCQKNGMPPAMVAELLGHSSVAVTELYTHLGSIAILSEAVRKHGISV